MLVLKHPNLSTIALLTILLLASFPLSINAQGSSNSLSNYMGTISLDIQSQPLPNDMNLSQDQSLMVISFGGDLSQRIMDNPIKYANPIRIWLSKSTISPNQAYFYVNKASHELTFTPKTEDVQTLILSGLADFSSKRKNMAFQKGMLYTLTIEIEKMPTEMPEMEVAMNPKTTYLFEENQSTSLEASSTMEKNAKWYSFAWVKPVVKNKYVKWGAGAVVLSAASYFGYQQFSGSSGGTSLPLPPAPPQ